MEFDRTKACPCGKTINYTNNHENKCKECGGVCCSSCTLGGLCPDCLRNQLKQEDQ